MADEIENGEMPESTTEQSVEEIKAQLADAQKRIKELNRESAERRKKLEALEASETARKTAEMTDAEKAKAELEKALPELEALRKEKAALLLQSRFEKVVREMQITFAGERAADVAFSLLDRELIGEDGHGMKEALSALQKEHGYLFSQAQAPQTDAGQKGKADGDMAMKEILAKKRSAYGAL